MSRQELRTQLRQAQESTLRARNSAWAASDAAEDVDAAVADQLRTMGNSFSDALEALLLIDDELEPDKPVRKREPRTGLP